jgi:uncharacterized phage protein gp47/JayE
MTPLSAAALIAKQTADEILDLALQVARLVGLPVDTWRTGDPTRTLFRSLATKMATADAIQSELAKASFITGPEDERAQGDWLSLRVADVYGVEREEATFSTPSVTFDNAGGGLFEMDTRGLVVSSSATGATFRNQSPVVIPPNTTGVVVTMIADVAGTAGSVGLNEIDTIVSPSLSGVTIASSAVAAGSDAQSDAGLIEQALATLGALSPNGPADAYEFVARNDELTGIAGVTRAQAVGDSGDGTVTVYVAASATGLDGPSVAAIQAAVDTWAQPLCTDATVVSGTPQTVAVTYVLTPAHPDAQTDIEAAVDAYFAALDFGGLVVTSALVSIAHVVCGPTLTKAVVTIPGADLTLAAGVFPVRGTVVLS